MKRSLKFLSMALLAFGMVFMSACSDDEGGKKTEVKITPIKKIVFNPSWGDIESYEFTYDEQGRVATMVNIYDDEEPVTSTFNYSVANQLTITKSTGGSTIYDLDNEGRIIKEYWNEEKTEWEAYEYNADGFMVELTERWGGDDYLKYTAEASSTNVTEHTRYDDEGEPNRTKVFNYSTLGSAVNVNAIHQTDIKESNWQWVGGFLGKASKGLVDNLQYWAPGDEANKKTTEIDYDFEGDLMMSMSRVGSDFTEEYTFTYYEDVE
jgi:hypothetical protein